MQDVDVAKVLLQNGADVNAVNEGRWTALHMACEHAQYHIVKLLLQNGANVHVSFVDMRTCFMYTKTPLDLAIGSGWGSRSVPCVLLALFSMVLQRTSPNMQSIRKRSITGASLAD